MATVKTWTTREGEIIPVRKMTDSHVINTVRFFRRRALELRLAIPYPTFNGEMAQLFAEQDWERLDEMDDDEFLCATVDGFEYVLDEAERRHLST